MGEAKQRKIARMAGAPWEQDRPPIPPTLPWYRDPMCPQPPARPAPAPPSAALKEELPRVLVVDDGKSRNMEILQRVLEKDHEVQVVKKDVLVPARRRPRPNSMELMAMLAALSTGIGQGATDLGPGGGGRRE